MSQVTTVELLKEARTRIEQGWCQATGARDPLGAPCPASKEAHALCLYGALLVACHSLPLEEARRQRDALVGRVTAHLHARWKRQYGEQLSLIRWNDQPDRTQADVLALLEEVIECLK